MNRLKTNPCDPAVERLSAVLAAAGVTPQAYRRNRWISVPNDTFKITRKEQEAYIGRRRLAVAAK